MSGQADGAGVGEMADPVAWPVLEQQARALLDRTPDDADALGLLALSLAQQQRATEALPLFRAAAQRQPQEPAHWLNLGNACLALDYGADALHAFTQARAAGARGIELELGEGLALRAQGDHARAARSLAYAYALEPDAADVAVPYAQCLCELERYDEALACVQPLDRRALEERHRHVLAWVLSQAGADASAEVAFQDEIERTPYDADLRLHYALLLERLNRLDEAEAQLQSGIVEHTPASVTKALAFCRVLRRRKRYAEALRWADAGLATTDSDSAIASMQFERAKLLDSLDDADAAMAALAQAHAACTRAVQTRHADAHAAPELRWLDDRLQTAAPTAWSTPIAAAADADPCFLVGFPRSGTTLLENVLDSHPQLVSLDERPALEDVIATIKAAGFATPARLMDVDAKHLHDWRGTYWQQVQGYLGALPAQRQLLDKYPLYLSRLPYIARLFPQARVIALLRHPCDCVLSCYLQSFGLGGGALSFGSLEQTAQTYAEVMGQWEEQRLRVATPIHVLRYEDLVRDFHGEVGRVLEFIGLEWDPAIEHFGDAVHERKTRIRTPSYSQVGEPVNDRAVYRWKRYRKHFSPRVMGLLQPFIERYGYA